MILLRNNCYISNSKKVSNFIMHEGPFGKPARKNPPFINITSLIDVMFLLLIFLIITTTFNPHLGLSLQLPEANTSKPVEELDTCRIIIDAKGNLSLLEKDNDNSKLVTIEELENRLRELKTNNPPPLLILESDAEAPFRSTVKVFDLALELGYPGVTIATKPKEEGIIDTLRND